MPYILLNKSTVLFCACLATTWWQAFIGTSKKAKQYEKPTRPSFTKPNPWKNNSE